MLGVGVCGGQNTASMERESLKACVEHQINESKTGIKNGDFYFPSICLNFRTILSFLEFPSFILFLVLEAKPMSLIHTSSPAQTSESQDRAFNLQFYGGVGAFLNLAPMLP